MGDAAMELKFTKSTGKEEKVKLDSFLVYACWTSGKAIGGQKAGVEVGTAFVGNGASIKITGKSEKGKKLSKLDGNIRGNKFVGELDIPEDIEVGDFVYFEVKLPKNSLSGESERIPAFPPLQIDNLRWSAAEARRGDTLKLSAEARGVRDGTPATLTIYEHDQDGAHDKITELPATVDKEKIEVSWAYEYHEDVDEIPTEEQMQRYGRHYNPPEYFFTVKIEGNEFGRKQESGLLNFKDWVDVTATRADGTPCADSEYKITLADGSTREGRLDSAGQVRIEDVPPGHYRIFIKALAEQE